MNLQETFLIVPAILIAVTLHELAHGYVAFLLGDPTAKNAGRLTLNPIPHIDPVGALMFVFFKIGWAKPVPVNPAYFRHPVQDMAKVALAGPSSNMLLAFGGSLIFHASLPIPMLFNQFLVLFVVINIGFAVFNMLPIPPLDGSRILPAFLSEEKAASFYRFEPYGAMIILVGFLFFGELFMLLIEPPIRFLIQLLL